MADAFTLPHLRECTCHQYIFKSKINMENHCTKTEAPKGKRSVQGHPLASDQGSTRKSLSIPPVRGSFHQIALVSHPARAECRCSLHREGAQTRGKAGKRERGQEGAGKVRSLPAGGRKFAAQPGCCRAQGAHLSGTQRRVVRSRDTDTKAPGG